MNFNRMKLILIVLVAFSLSSCHGELTEQIAEEEIRLAISEQQDAWNAGDVELFMSWYKNDADLSFTTSGGLLKGHDKLLARYQKSYPNKKKMGRLEFEILDYKPAGDNHAVLVGKWVLYRSDDTPQGYFSLLWERTDTGWKIIHDHTS